MARANPANKPQPNDAAETENKQEPITEFYGEGADIENKKAPIIEFYGEGAEDVKFNIDPNANRIRVYASGLILTDY